MDDRSIKFLIFGAFSALCLVVGYLARRRGWMDEQISRPLHLHTVIWTWAPAALFSAWQLQLHDARALLQLGLVMLLQPVLMVLAWLMMAPLARRLGCQRGHVAVLGLGAVLGNQGFTLGAYLCYTLLQPADQALGYATAYLTSQLIFSVLIFYPVIQCYAPGNERPMGQLILSSFLDIRAILLYAGLAGIGLSIAQVPVPAWVGGWHLLDVLFFLGAAGAYIGIGLRLRLGDSRRYLLHHGLLAVSKFLIWPVVSVGLVTVLVAMNLPLNEPARSVVIIEAFAPTAIASVILSNLFHLDARLASVLWVWNTLLFCLIPLPLLILLH